MVHHADIMFKFRSSMVGCTAPLLHVDIMNPAILLPVKWVIFLHSRSAAVINNHFHISAFHHFLLTLIKISTSSGKLAPFKMYPYLIISEHILMFSPEGTTVNNLGGGVVKNAKKNHSDPPQNFFFPIPPIAVLFFFLHHAPQMINGRPLMTCVYSMNIPMFRIIPDFQVKTSWLPQSPMFYDERQVLDLEFI